MDFFLENREGIQRGCSCAQQILCIGGGKCLRVPKVKTPFAHWQRGVHFRQYSWAYSWPLHKDETHKTRLQSLTELLDLACENTLHY